VAIGKVRIPQWEAIKVKTKIITDTLIDEMNAPPAELDEDYKSSDDEADEAVAAEKATQIVRPRPKASIPAKGEFIGA
jgi:hypothetical protein